MDVAVNNTSIEVAKNQAAIVTARTCGIENGVDHLRATAVDDLDVGELRRSYRRLVTCLGNAADFHHLKASAKSVGVQDLLERLRTVP